MAWQCVSSFVSLGYDDMLNSLHATVETDGSSVIPRIVMHDLTNSVSTCLLSKLQWRIGLVEYRIISYVDCNTLQSTHNGDTARGVDSRWVIAICIIVRNVRVSIFALCCVYRQPGCWAVNSSKNGTFEFLLILPLLLLLLLLFVQYFAEMGQFYAELVFNPILYALLFTQPLTSLFFTHSP